MTADTWSTERLSQKLKALGEECQSTPLSLALLLSKLGTSSHALIVLVLSIPFLLPIPVPGLSVIFGGIIASSGIGIALNKPIWLPSKVKSLQLSGALIGAMLISIANVIKRIEMLVKPRLGVFSENDVARVTSGTLILISGFLLFLPLPPGTNFPPAIVCTLLAIGLLERDGVFSILGYMAFVLKVFFISTFYLYISEMVAKHFQSLFL